MNDAVIDSPPTTDIPQAPADTPTPPPTAEAAPEAAADASTPKRAKRKKRTKRAKPTDGTEGTEAALEALPEDDDTELVVIEDEPPLIPRPLSQRDVVLRLRRIEGQVRGLIDMVQAGRCSEDVAQQMAAARKAMDKAFYRMMTGTVIEAMCESNVEFTTLREIERSARILEKYA